MKLIEPGKYDFSYNQEYLLAKLWNIDIYSSLFWYFWLTIFLCILTYIVIRALRNVIKEDIERLQQYKQQEMNDICNEFHTLCRLISEDLNTFKRPYKMIEKMYYPELKKLVYKMSKIESYIQKNYYYLVPDYKYYRQKFMRDDDGA